MENRKTFIYDWDGTAVDSLVLTSHFLNDSLKKEKPDAELLPVDNPEELRKSMNRFRGMGNFFSHHGFSDEQYDRVKDSYRLFASKYSLDLFPGIKNIFESIKQKEHSQLIVSFNHIDNILPVLRKNQIPKFMFNFIIGGEELKKFHNANKSDYINFYMGHTITFPEDMYLIGDTKGDYYSAMNSGINFIGVNYGFDSFEKGDGFPVADSVEELEKILLKESKQ